MKKVLSLVCVLALTLSCLFALTSCFGGTPNADPEAAKAALEGNDYFVQDLTSSFRYIDGIKAVITASYSDADLEDLEDMDSFEDLADIEVETVTIFYFDSEEKATAAFEAIEKVSKDSTDTVDVCEQSGAMIYFGTSAGVKAAS